MSRGFARILVPTDFSPASDRAVAFARTLAHKYGAALHIIHVLAEWPLGDTAVVQTLLDAQLRSDERMPLRATGVLLRGATATTIVDYADAHAIDLIVMGHEGQAGHGSVGRVVDAVVRFGPCPVLTVKEERELACSSSTLSTFH